MTTRSRVAHTASFLQTFHTGQTTAARRADVGAEGSEPKPVAAAEAQAVSFVTNRPARPSNPGEYEVEIKGHKVKVGGSFISEAQAKWILDIVTTRETPGPAEAVLTRLAQGFAKYAGSQFITAYKDLPKKYDSGDSARAEAIAPGAPTPTTIVGNRVADGRYAVEHEGVLKFFKLKNGRKPGFVFLDVQASDDWHPIRNPGKIAEIVRLIAAEPEAAQVRYGQEIGRCYRCNRTLTDETSRDLGIGPDCRAK